MSEEWQGESKGEPCERQLYDAALVGKDKGEEGNGDCEEC